MIATPAREPQPPLRAPRPFLASQARDPACEIARILLRARALLGSRILTETSRAPDPYSPLQGTVSRLFSCLRAVPPVPAGCNAMVMQHLEVVRTGS